MQVSGNSISKLVHLGIGIHLVQINHCRTLRCQQCLLAEQLHNGLCPVIGYLCLIESIQSGLHGGIHQPDSAEGFLAEHLLNHGEHGVGEAPHGLLAVQLISVIQQELIAAMGLRHHHVQIELGLPGVQGLCIQPFSLQHGAAQQL